MNSLCWPKRSIAILHQEIKVTVHFIYIFLLFFYLWETVNLDLSMQFLFEILSYRGGPFGLFFSFQLYSYVGSLYSGACWEVTDMRWPAR